MDLASDTLTLPEKHSVPEASACSCALHEPLQDSGQDLPGRIAGEYVSLSSYSEAWLAYARHYGQNAVRRFNLGAGSVVLEFADGAEGRSMSSPVAQGKPVDLVIARNLLAQVPDPDDIVAGFAATLKSDGILILEFPHTSLSAAEALLGRHGLRVFDLDELSTPGGLRLFCCPAGSARREQASVVRLRRGERAAARAISRPVTTVAS